MIVDFEGKRHEFPDDATDAEVAAVLGGQPALAPNENPDGIGDKVNDKRRLTAEQRLAVLEAQWNDPRRNPAFDGDLRREIAILKRQMGAAPESPADAKVIPPAPAAAAPRASQADVRRTEPQPLPMEKQRDDEAGFEKNRKAWIAATGGVLKPGQNVQQAVAAWSGQRDPAETRDAAQAAHAGATGELEGEEDTLAHQLGKPLAATAGFALGGPGGATLAEGAVRYATLSSALDKAVKAGTLSEDEAASILYEKMAKGMGQDALFNFGLPLLGQVVQRLPGAKWVGEKVTGKIQGLSKEYAATLAKRKGLGKTPEQQEAVERLAKQAGDDFVPTPGQVTGEASAAEQAARLTHPGVFERQQKALGEGAERMRQEAVNPGVQPSAKVLGERVQAAAEATQQAVKKRLRPTFQAADDLGVKVDMNTVAAKARDALAKDAAVPGGKLKATERADLEALVTDIEAAGKSSIPGAISVDTGKFGSEAALDFMSRQKEKVRAISADGVPSKYYQTIVDDLTRTADEEFARAAGRAGKGDVVRNLLSAQRDYKEMMETVYDDAVKAALKKNPEDVGRLFWQSGNVSEIEQFHKLLQIAQREGALGKGESTKLARDMTRGFMQEAIRDVPSAAKWSETLAADPLKRRTWEALTRGPGGKTIADGMKVIEEASKIAMRDNPALAGGGNFIMFSRAAKGGLGVSYVTGALHPGIAVVGISITAATRMMATAYTRGDKGVARALMAALRAQGAGTAASAKALQAALPEIEQAAVDYGIEDIFVSAADAAATAASGSAQAADDKNAKPAPKPAPPKEDKTNRRRALDKAIEGE